MWPGAEAGIRNLEARGGIEPPMKVLQTFALPLGDRAVRRPNHSMTAGLPFDCCSGYRTDPALPSDPRAPATPRKLLCAGRDIPLKSNLTTG
jgi:hypothetical protein